MATVYKGLSNLQKHKYFKNLKGNHFDVNRYISILIVDELSPSRKIPSELFLLVTVSTQGQA